MSINYLERLAKWRTVFAGWQLGTRPKSDPECQAVRDINEARLIMRAELSALAGLLIKKGVFTAEEFTDFVQEEARILEEMLQKKFPGAKADDYGMVIDLKQWATTVKDWRA